MERRPADYLKETIRKEEEEGKLTTVCVDAQNTGSSINLREIVVKYIRRILGSSPDMSNLENLRKIYNHFKNTEKINNYFKQMNEENRRLYDHIALPIDSRTPAITNQAESAVEEVLEIVNMFVAESSNSAKVSILSPRLLSLFPESSSGNRFLSPTFFSFQKNGYLSLPELFDIISSDQKQQQFLLDIVLDASGAGAVLKVCTSFQ
uniref:Uncharacterized protein n=1 Tax=Angiostrongylus cantonensis TaxID=6313 RepID=A0A0K0DQW2_ANGCA